VANFYGVLLSLALFGVIIVLTLICWTLGLSTAQAVVAVLIPVAPFAVAARQGRLTPRRHGHD
jgi:hypothetical protein